MALRENFWKTRIRKDKIIRSVFKRYFISSLEELNSFFYNWSERFPQSEFIINEKYEKDS
ncbi:hypothetical protein AKJ40_03635 [candidate division MSBL1 archaeon SCGC-AAA259M10]|uniref:Uncharacterized protein n=2 Tax=candidate division MSBL1 TaxID=215777 RepID=A0A133UYF8_9EURY|nr:hypothetical protein AKJ66_00360 [candidate division MSBL1 archaeon SCGC-AAA259E22]KXA99240.1 hypothetical protein AKJ40_03635 [candidate division MSBL1 archaeon SCGC-AAA259M10]